MSRRGETALVFALFLVSGALGLGYQVLWSKHLLHFIGASAWSYAVVLAAFMSGLAIGGAWLGARADRSPSPLALYGWLELGVAVYALAFEPLRRVAERAYLVLAGADPDPGGATAGLALKAILAALLLLVPTVLMGGTLPALTRHFSGATGVAAHRAAGLYAVNALGAALGALGMAFVLLPALGMLGSLLVLAAGNLAVALAASGLARGSGVRPVEPAPPGEEGVPGAAWLPASAVGLLVLAGIASFSLEVAWTRFFALLLGSSTYSFAVMLAAFIAGIALGSAVVARLGARLAAPLVTFGWVQVAAGALVLVLLPLYPYLTWPVLRMSVRLAAAGPGAFYLREAGKLLLCALVMLPATTLLGMSIPLMLRAIRRGTGRSTGRVYAWNTIGNVAGALVAGLFLLPLLGMEALLRACGAATVATGVAALLVFGDPGPSRARRLGGAGLMLVAALAVLAAAGPWDLTWFTLYPSRREADRSLGDTRRVLAVREVVLFRDDPAANVLVMAGHGADRTHYSLLVNGKPDASTGTDMPTQVLLGHLPMLLHPRPGRALIVGFASGITAGAVLEHDVERLDVVDIVGTMREASDFFRAWNRDPLSDPRLHFIVDDARAYIARTGARYDVVIAEPSNPWVAGTGALFATEFYRQAAACLAPGGIYLQWIQAYELSDDTLGAILRSFRRAFPHALAFQAAPQDLLLVGTREPFRPDWPALAARFARPAVTEQLATVGIRSPAALLLLERISGGTIDLLAAAAERENTDDNLLLEHRGPRDLFALAQPEMLGELDERLAGGSGLLLTRYLRETGEELDPLAVAAALDDGLVSGAVARGVSLTLRRLFLARPGGPAPWPAGFSPSFRALAPDFVPLDSPALAAEIAREIGSRDHQRLRQLLDAYRTSILLEVAWSRAQAELWVGSIRSALEALPGGQVPLPVMRFWIDLLAAAGHFDEAGERVTAMLAAASGEAAAELVPPACRIDPGALCDRAVAAAAGSGSGSGSGSTPQLERFAAIRHRLAPAGAAAGSP